MNDKQPTLVPAGEAAIVTSDGMQQLQLLIPDFGDDQEVPEALMFLSAVFVRYSDEEFRKEQLDWMENRRKN